MSATNLQTVLCAMDAVEALKGKKEILNSAANLDVKKAQIKEELRKIYASQSIAVTEEILDAGVEETFRKEHTFKAPTSPLAEKCALFLINRQLQGTIAATILFILGAFICTKVITHTIAERQMAELKSETKDVEDSIRNLTQKLNQFPLTLASAVVDNEGPVKAGALVLDRQGYSEKIPQAKLAYAEAAKETDLPKKKKLLHEANSLLTGIEKDNKTLSDLQNVYSDIIQKRDTFVSTPNLEPKLVTEANAIASAGTLAVATANLKDAYSNSTLLSRLAEKTANAKQYTNELQVALAQVQKYSKDPAANQLAESLGIQAKEAIANDQLDRVPELLKQLNAIALTLQQSYDLRIVSRQGVKSGAWRYPTDQKGNNAAKRFYVIVEAISPSGQALPQEILSEEDGQTRHVTLWGERVTEAAFEAVKADKLDNNIIEDNTFGKKEVGYLYPTFSKGTKAGNPQAKPQSGRITTW